MEFIHWATIDDEPAGMCWKEDHYPDIPQKVSTDITKVTCKECIECYIIFRSPKESETK